MRVQESTVLRLATQVPARAGPGGGDPSSVLWLYHGHSAESADTYAGLVGPIIISKKGVSDKALGIDRCCSSKTDRSHIEHWALPTAPTPPFCFGFVASTEHSQERIMRKPRLTRTPQARAA